MNKQVEGINPIITIAIISTVIGIIVYRYVSRIKTICECLERANNLMKDALDDASSVIKKQDDEIRRLSNGEPVADSSSKTDDINQEEADGEWHLYLVKRSSGAPELNMNDITRLLVVAMSGSQAMDFAKEEKGFVDDDWWDVEKLSICYEKRGVLFREW